jgi:hypothetical protein
VSFGANQSVKNAQNQQLAETQQANAQSNAQFAAGSPNVTSGTNFLSTILNGNRANTTAVLQPNIDQIRQANQQQLQGISTLTPRGGGRSGTLFGASYAPNQQIQSLFGGARTSAASALPQIGLQQEGLGTNLLNTGASSANAGVQNALQVQQMSNAIDAAIGGGLFGLASLPVSGGGSLAGNLFGGGGNGWGTLCWIAAAVYGADDIRTHAVRQWLAMEYSRTRIGSVVVGLYRKIGRQIAPLVRGPVRWMLRPVFDMALRRALA